ncbi:MAG: hypothetical protein GY801_16610 [bacterium]|nr:hypothetical protein [bacterium]
MESFLGFNERFQPGNWAPLTLTLENRGRDIEGSLEVIVTSGSEYLQNIYQSTYSADVELPYNSKRLYAFSIKLNSFTHDVQIRLRQGGELLLSRSIALRSAVTEKPFVLVADEKASPDFLSDFPPQIFPVNVRPKFLPEHSYAYESVRMMILNIGILRKLRENQFQALLGWITQGGYLVMTGGMNVGAFSGARARQLFPAQILGHREFIELQSLKDFCGQSFRSASPFLLLQIHSQDAKVLLQEREFPLLALREMGKGRILFSAFHDRVPAFRRWAGKLKFREALLALHDPAKNSGRLTLPSQKILDAMFANSPAVIPNPKNLVLLLGLYLLLLRWFFRRLQNHRARQRGNAIACLTLILVCVSLSYLLFRANDKNALSYNAFLHLHGSASSQQADANYTAGLYTVQKTDYTLFFDSASYPIVYLPATRSEGAPPQAYRVHQTAGGQEVHGSSGNWRSQFFRFSGVVEFPLSAEARLHETSLELLIRNDSDRMIQHCRVYIQQNLFTLGNLQAGEERRYNIPLAEIREKEFFNPREFTQKENVPEHHEKVSAQENQMMRYGREALQRLLARQNAEPYMLAMQKKLLPNVLNAVHTRYQARPDLLCLVGWLPESQIEMNIPQKNAPGESLTLVTWEISLH